MQVSHVLKARLNTIKFIVFNLALILDSTGKYALSWYLLEDGNLADDEEGFEDRPGSGDGENNNLVSSINSANFITSETFPESILGQSFQRYETNSGFGAGGLINYVREDL